METSASSHTNASSRVFISTRAGFGAAFGGPLRRGGRRRRLGRRRGLRRCRGGGRGLGVGTDGGVGVGTGDGFNGFGRGCSLVLELADEGLGHGTSPSAGSQEDVPVESGENVAELCPKIVSGHFDQFPENRCLVLKRTGMREVLMKLRDAVDDQGEDVGDLLGADVR